MSSTDALRRAGVYVTSGELRGVDPIVRGSLTLHPEPAAFRNPASRTHFTLTSGGSGGALRGHLLDLATLRASALDVGLAHEALGIVPERFAAWDTPGPLVPPSGVLDDGRRLYDPVEGARDATAESPAFCRLASCPG